MPASKIMRIRHAEKPGDDGTIQAVRALLRSAGLEPAPG